MRCMWNPGELLLQLVAWDDAQQSLFGFCFGEASSATRYVYLLLDL